MKLKNNFLCAFLIAGFFATSAFAQTPKIAEDINAADNLDASYKLTIDKVDQSRFYNVAVVQGLNKTTAKTSILEMRIGDKIRFGQITIIAHKCWQASLDQKPESKILLEVFEDQQQNDEEKAAKAEKNSRQKRIFYGWMFASSPSISGLENPIYDITALGCKNK